MTEATEHPAPRKRGRPRKTEKKTAKRADRKPAKQAEKPLDLHAARDTLDRMVLLMDRVAWAALIEQADEVRDLATEAHGLATDIDEMLTDLRRELHIALRTRGPETDHNLPRDVVDVMDYIGGAAESLQQAADEIVGAVEKERK
jgi:hypothetical protein